MKLKYDIDQKLAITNIPWDNPDVGLIGEHVTVVALPGYHPTFPNAYGVRFQYGNVRPVAAKHLRLCPPVLSHRRLDIDVKLSWEEFEKQTGLSAESIKRGPATAM